MMGVGYKMFSNFQFNPLISVTICLNGNSPSVNSYDNIIKHFSECLGLHVQIDGDPFQYPELCDFLKKLKKYNVQNIGIRTGTPIDETLLCSLKRYNIRSILFRHNMKNLKENIRLVQKYKISTEVSVLISKDILPTLPKFLAYLKKIGIDLLVIERSIVADYRQKKIQPLDKNDYYQLLRFILENNYKTDSLKIAISHCPNKILLHSSDAYAQLAGGCSGGIISCAIDWNGNIIPCLPLWKIVLGNIFTDDFMDIWNKSPLLLQLRNRENIKGKCGKCSFKISCGGCRAESYKHFGNLFEEDITCWK